VSGSNRSVLPEPITGFNLMQTILFLLRVSAAFRDLFRIQPEGRSNEKAVPDERRVPGGLGLP
jgi:hypothetical protein